MRIFTGIDIVENGRIKKAVEKHGEKFLNRIFRKDELEYCGNRAEKIPCLAARFAVKEAFIKAFFQATGITLSYREVEIKGNTGRPAEILLHPRDEKTREAINRIKYTFSLSHEKNYSVAIVVIHQD